jgi:hypothetical protein
MRPELDADPAWVAALSGAGRAAAERALATASGDRRLYRHLAQAHRKEGRDSYVEIDAPLELHALVRLLGPRHIVEVGVSSGVSSAYLLRALEENGTGTLHSVDLPARPRGDHDVRASWSLPPNRDTGWAVPSSLRRRWDLRLGDKADVLPRLAEELPSVDLLVYDVPHRDPVTRRELARLDPRIGPGGVVVIDHGPGGGLCEALRGLAHRWGSSPVRRAGLGLYGVRRTSAPPSVPSAARGRANPLTYPARPHFAPPSRGHRGDPEGPRGPPTAPGSDIWTR